MSTNYEFKHQGHFSSWDKKTDFPQIIDIIRTYAFGVIPVKLVLAEAGNGNPEYVAKAWIPAYAGMTEEKMG